MYEYYLTLPNKYDIILFLLLIMKNLSLIFVIGLLFISTASYSQYQATVEGKEKMPNFWFGPKVGVNLFTPTIDQNEIQTQFQSNYQIGVFFQFGRKFYFQPEFYYATQKEKSSVLMSKDVTVNTLKVPLMLGMRLINLKVISAHIMAGPSASFLLNESFTDPNNARQKSNFAIEAGGGIDLIGFITLDVRYSVDMSKSMNDQIKQLGWDSGVNVTLGLKIR